MSGHDIEFSDFLEIDDEHKDYALRLYQDCGMYIGVDAILSTGCSDSIKFNVSRTTRALSAILEYPYLSDQWKIEHLTQSLIMCPYHDHQLYHNPTLVKYMKMIPVAEVENLSTDYKEFILNGTIPTLSYSPHLDKPVSYISNYDIGNLKLFLVDNKIEHLNIDGGMARDYALLIFEQSITDQWDQHYKDRIFSSMINNEDIRCGLTKSSICADPRLSDYWSRIPTDDELFLQFLNWRGVELPPPIGDEPSIARLSKRCTTDDVLGLIYIIEYSEHDQLSHRALIVLLQLINRRIVDIRSYLEYDHPTVYALMEYLPTYGKSSRSIISM